MSSSQGLRISIARESAAIVVTVLGDLDVFAAPNARAHLNEAIERAAAHSVELVVVDTAGLGFCDSTGLSVLVRAHDDAQRKAVQFGLRNPSPPLRDLLGNTGLSQLLHPDS